MNDTTKTTKATKGWSYDDAYAWGLATAATGDWSWDAADRMGPGYEAGYRAGLQG